MALMLNDTESNKMTKAEQQAMLQQLFTQEQLDLIYDALNEYELVAQCNDENSMDDLDSESESENFISETDILQSVLDIIVSVE
jgi:penicillin V acylase-like amidase (Ntn superfamily)